MSTTVWYVGIGSMMNGTALRLRGINPVQSVWCEILDHRRVFYGPATLVEDAAAVTHAVAHEMTPHELEMLEAREPPSKAVRVLLRRGPRAGQVIQVNASVDLQTVLHGISLPEEQVGAQVHQEGTGASAYVTRVTGEAVVVNFTNRIKFGTKGVLLINGLPCGVPNAITFIPPPEALPSARYISLMVEGARDAGMDPTEIEKISSTPCSPRKSSSQLGRIPVRAEAQKIFLDEELRRGPYVVFRGMVLAPGAERSGFQLAWRPRLYNGIPDASFDISRFIYDPLYGMPPASPYASWDGWANIEDVALNGPWLQGYVHVGWVASPQSKL